MRDLRGLSPDLRRRLAPHIDGLTGNPRPPGVEKLEDSDSGYRIRVGTTASSMKSTTPNKPFESLT